MSSRRIKKEVLETNKVSENTTNSEDLAMDPKGELQTMWKVPATAQFVSLCRFCFKLPEIEIEDLEDGLLQTTEVGRKVLLDLLVGLLRSIRPQRGINIDNFEEHLRKQLVKIKETGECLNITLSEEVTFSKLDVTSKVDLLYSLCLSRLDRADVPEAMKDMDAEALRVQPLGGDDLGNEYWYFYGTRLYKQEPSTEKKKDWQEEWVEQKNQSFNKRGRGRPRKNAPRKSEHENEFEGEKSDRRYMNIDEKSRWSVVCNSIEDWVDFAEKFKKSKSRKEQALFVTVTDNFLPVLNEIYQEKERKLKEKLRQLIPKPVPRRIETRRMTTRRTAEVDMNGFDSVNAHKEHLVRDRAHRLEERNRRASSQVSNERSRSRSSRRNYIDEEDKYDDDDFESFSQDTSRDYASEERRQDLMPLISTDVTDLKSKVLHVLSEVKLQKDAWPFLYPVEESYAPGYYEIIQEPMDLSTMSKKLMDNSYRTINDIDEDFERMVSNCQLYNGEHSAMSKMVINLWKVFRKSLSKMFGSSTQDSPPVSNKPSSKSQQTDSDSQDSTYGKRKADSVNKKRKKKAYHKNALETLSKEAQLAVEKSQNSEKMQIDMSVSHPKQYSMYSDLKIVPINNHPADLIEKFSSDSSNQDDNDFNSYNDPSSPYGNQSSNSQSPSVNETNNMDTEIQMKPRSAPSIHFISQSDYTSELSELIEKTSPKSFDILPDDNEANNVLPNNSLHNTSISSLSSHHSSSPDISGHARSPQNAVQNAPQPAVPDGTVPLLPDSFGINELDSFTSPYGTSTVNASALGLTSTQTGFRKPVSSSQIPMTTSFGPNSQASFTTATCTSAQVPVDRSNLQPLRSSPTFSTQVPVPESNQLANQQNQGIQVTKESAQYYQFQKSSTEIAFPGTSGVTFASQVPMAPVVTNSSAQIPLQVPVPYSKAFPNQNNLVLQQQEGNKFPNVKFSLPPSTGEILLVPGDQASSSMTFHLFAQPSANQSQPIQSSMELKASNSNTNVGSLSNQQAASTVERQGISNKVTMESVIRPQKRKSPLQDLIEPAVQATPVTTSLPSMPKTSELTSGFPGPVRFTDASSNFSSAFANSTNAGIRPLQRLQYNPANTSISYSNEMSVLQASSMKSNAPLQQNSNMLQVPVTVQKTMPTAFPNPNTVFVSTNCNATTTSSVISRSSNVAVKKIQLPNGTLPMNSNSIIQNANGQLIFIPTAKEPAQRPVGEVQAPKVQSGGKPLPPAVTCSPFFPSANNTVMQSFAFQNAPMNQSQIYTQVVPSQLQPQFVNNNPYYIITDPNAFQSTQRYPVVNMQPISFTNR